MPMRDGNTIRRSVSKEKRPGAYLLWCADHTLYAGWTNDIEQRVACHNSGRGAKYTRSRLPVTLAYWEECADQSEAMRLEARLKKMSRAQKIALIERAKSKER